VLPEESGGAGDEDGGHGGARSLGCGHGASWADRWSPYRNRAI